MIGGGGVVMGLMMTLLNDGLNAAMFNVTNLKTDSSKCCLAIST